MTSRVSPARRTAFDLLSRLRRDAGVNSDELLRPAAVNALSAADRNLVTALVMGVLRWESVLDERISAVSTQTSPPPAPVELALELGALQLLLFDRIPAHAAIFESVELAKESGNEHAAGFVNAVLRKLASSPKLGLPVPRPADAAELAPASAADLARTLGHPAWLVERWWARYGVDSTQKICAYDQSLPPTTVRLLTAGAEAALLDEEIECEAAEFVERARKIRHGDVTKTRAFAEGHVRIQDEGSQLIAEIAARGLKSSEPRMSEPKILDLCAAPGGKTAILAERNPLASLLACDIQPRRLRAMRALLRKQQGLSRIDDRIAYRVLDGVSPVFDNDFDLVLCDAPCSGTGTLARNPEIRHRLRPEDLLPHRGRQIALLSAAMQALAPGGRLVYSTCSLEEEENESVVESVLRQAGATGRQFRLLSLRRETELLEEEGILRPGSTGALGISPETFLRTLPGVHACDGFFAALVTRV